MDEIALFELQYEILAIVEEYLDSISFKYEMLDANFCESCYEIYVESDSKEIELEDIKKMEELLPESSYGFTISKSITQRYEDKFKNIELIFKIKE